MLKALNRVTGFRESRTAQGLNISGDVNILPDGITKPVK